MRIEKDLRLRLLSLCPDMPYLEISFRVIRPDGTVIWAEMSSRAHFDEQGRMLRIVGMVADITERKRTEEALRESEERLRLAVQAGRMYVFEWDAVSDTIVRSGRCSDILNWLGDPARDTGQQFIARVHPDDSEAYAATATRLTLKHPSYQTSYRMLRPDGSVIWLEESVHGFFDSKGGLLRTIGMVADVTERKLAEEAVSSVSRRLIEAQEQERARIARELHDDLSQMMALLQIGLDEIRAGYARPFVSDTATTARPCGSIHGSFVQSPRLVSPASSIQAGRSGSHGLHRELLQRILSAAQAGSPVCSS